MRGETGGGIAGMFTEKGVLGMLGAKIYDHVDFVSPFLDKIVHFCSRNVKSAPVTDLSMQGADLVHTIKKQNSRTGWTKIDYARL